jgi:uncharacterized protein YPO0396
MENWPELLVKLFGDGFIGAVIIWLCKGWVEAKILEPLLEMKKKVEKIEDEQDETTDKLSKAAFNVTTASSELQGEMTKSTQKMITLFSQAASESAQAKVDAHIALEKTQALEKDTDQKLRNVVQNVGGKVKIVEGEIAKVKSETEEIRKDVFYIKGKK